MTAGPRIGKDEAPAGFDRAADRGRLALRLWGAWTVRHSVRLDRALSGVAAAPGGLVLDLGGLAALDTAGAWLIARTTARFAALGGAVEFAAGRPEHLSLISAVAAATPEPTEAQAGPPAFQRLLAEFGAQIAGAFDTARQILGFAGLILASLGRTLVEPRRLRLTSLVYHMEQAGLNAVPIVALMSFLIGAVLAYQGAEQLQRFGAEPFTVNLVTVSVLREIAILLTAIMVAGRSGSAFTAQLGSMKMREEIDAIRTLGLDPVEILILPRVLALVLTLPLLGFLAAMAGLAGGGLVCWVALDLTPVIYIQLVRDSVEVWSYWVGIIKAPVFAFLIAVIGCFEGMRVTGTAESVGQRTTQSVVEGIFTVIIADAVFSIVFVELGI